MGSFQRFEIEMEIQSLGSIELGKGCTKYKFSVSYWSIDTTPSCLILSSHLHPNLLCLYSWPCSSTSFLSTGTFRSDILQLHSTPQPPNRPIQESNGGQSCKVSFLLEFVAVRFTSSRGTSRSGEWFKERNSKGIESSILLEWSDGAFRLRWKDSRW